IVLQTYWVLVVMDQYTRQIIGFGIQRGVVDGLALCRMFKQAIRGAGLPKCPSSDHDPLYRFHQWEANFRVLGVNGNQDGSVHSLVPSVRRATDWNNPQRVFGPVVVLDRCTFGDETDHFQRLLQWVSQSCRAEGRNADRNTRSQGCESPIILLAA